jgi:hypothetical protein
MAAEGRSHCELHLHENLDTDATDLERQNGTDTATARAKSFGKTRGVESRRLSNSHRS